MSELTPEEVAIIREGWGQIEKNRKQNGMDLFLVVFTKKPEYQDLFAMLKGLSMEELKASPKLAAHGMTFMLGFQAFVDSLDDPATLKQLVRKNAERHAGRGILKEAFDSVFSLFIPFLESKLGDGFSDEARAAWTKVVNSLSQLTDKSIDNYNYDWGHAAGRRAADHKYT